MPYTAEHKQKTRTAHHRERAPAVQPQRLRRRSIGDIMGEAGLTHGGFYKHFSRQGGSLPGGGAAVHLRASSPSLAERAISILRPAAALARMIVDAYLSRRSFQ